MFLKVVMKDGEVKELRGVTNELFKLLMNMDEVKSIDVLGY